MNVRQGSRFLIIVGVMSATVMQVLDTTIVNVALPDMQGQLSATPDTVTWVLTSYLVASGVFMPLTGYFTDRFGQRRNLMISILGFVVASMLCGISTSLGEIVVFRLLQGVFGAALVPLSQSIMVQVFPVRERGKAMAIWGIGVMVGPILGPTLGGYLTDMFSWRWTFYVNLPVGIVSFLIAWLAVPDTERRERRMDWTGFTLMACAIGGLQMVLDRGNQQDWFSSNMILITTLVAAGGLVGFVINGLRRPERAIFDLRLFRDRNFALSCILIAAVGLSLYGTLVLQPILLEHLLGYPTATAGLIMAPRGIASMASMFMVGRLINATGPRPLMFVGIVLAAAGTFAMTRYNLDIDPWWAIWPILLQGLGMGMIFVPLSTVAFATLDASVSAEAAGMFSLTRTIGSAVGISIVTTVFTRQTQVAWNQLGGHLHELGGAVAHYLGGLGLSPSSPAAPALLGSELARQASMVAMVDAFALVAWSFVVVVPLVLLLRGGRSHLQAEAAALE
ncbi:MAG TPA: DHA2 family efflux MFS transporter permease subunit [Gammaproteobacteria bacterium]|nr:DHA2 family efflux MFS transporter permease subunit [Gammaproteobacteria bacterium]